MWIVLDSCIIYRHRADGQIGVGPVNWTGWSFPESILFDVIKTHDWIGGDPFGTFGPNTNWCRPTATLDWFRNSCLSSHYLTDHQFVGQIALLSGFFSAYVAYPLAISYTALEHDPFVEHLSTTYANFPRFPHFLWLRFLDPLGIPWKAGAGGLDPGPAQP